MRLPESIGFAPYLSTSLERSRRPRDEGGRARRRRPAARRSAGSTTTWLAELLSPAFSEWIERSPEGFEWELADGVLCVSRDGNPRSGDELTALCTDAAHVCQTIREECLEEVDAGEARRSAAKAPEPDGTARLAKLDPRPDHL